MIYIHPFEKIPDDGAASWDGPERTYRWGEPAIALGRHWDLTLDPYPAHPAPQEDAWSETLDELEEALIAHAATIMGERVALAPEYI